MYGCATTAAGPEHEVYVHTCMAVQQAAGLEPEMDVHMYGCPTTAMDLNLKSLAHMCVHVHVLTCMAVQQQQWT